MTADRLTALVRARAELLRQLLELDAEIATAQRENIQATVSGMLTGPYTHLSDRLTRDYEALHTRYVALAERVTALAAEVAALRGPQP